MQARRFLQLILPERERKFRQEPDTITLTGLTSGEKDLVVVVKDGSGNVSQQLVIRIPDIKNAGSGTGNNGSNSSAIHRPGSGGHKPKQEDRAVAQMEMVLRQT